MSNENILNVPVDTSFMRQESEVASVSEEKIGDALTEKAASESTSEPVPAQEEDKSASKFAALSRKEKDVRLAEQKLDQREQEFNLRQKEMDDKYSHYQNLQDRLRTEPLKVMEENNLTYQQLTEMVLNDGGKTTDMRLEDIETKYNTRIEQLENQLTERSKQDEEAKFDTVIEDFILDITDFVDENAQEYELIQANNGINLIYEVIEQHHQDTGNILSMKEATDHVEQYYVSEVEKHKELPKVRKLLGLESSEEEPSKEESQPSPTLTNTQASTVPNRTERLLSREDSLSEAAKLIRFDT